ILLESPHRLLNTLDDLRLACGDERPACVAREITKLFETFVSGSLLEVRQSMQEGTIKGEIVLLLGPQTAVRDISDTDILDAISTTRNEGLTPSALSKAVAKQLDIPRSRVYDLLLLADGKQQGNTP
ncbi:MAG: hypothetical protein Q9M23_03845, partial [Mariprofundaceae bacterium]|nr:hypothetical protein [Mariprofundaceae bacterium]